MLLSFVSIYREILKKQNEMGKRRRGLSTSVVKTPSQEAPTENEMDKMVKVAKATTEVMFSIQKHQQASSRISRSKCSSRLKPPSENTTNVVQRPARILQLRDSDNRFRPAHSS